MIRVLLTFTLLLTAFPQLSWGQEVKLKTKRGERRLFKSNTDYIIFPSRESTDFSSVKKSATRTRRTKVDKIAIRKRTKQELSGMKRGIQPRPQLGESAVYSSHPGGLGKLFALPGGLIITFKQSATEEQISQYIKDHGLIKKDRLSRRFPIFLFDSPAGERTLQIVNGLEWSEIIEDISPNWWTNVQTR